MAKSEKFMFKNEEGIKLSAVLELPDNTPVAYAIFAHCFGCSKDMIATTRIARSLTKSGIAVLRFDFTGLGSSSGDFADTTFSSNVKDLMSAAAYLREKYAAPQLIIGHSLGGAAAIMTASLVPEIKAVATIGAPSNPGHVSHIFSSKMDEIIEKGQAKIKLGGRELTITREYVEDIKEHCLESILPDLKRALIIFHSPIDEIVDLDHARILYKAARHPKSFVSIDGGDHLLTNKRDSEFVATILGAWAKRYLCASEVDPGE
jgi:putative redox protein